MGPPIEARAVLATACQEDALRNATLGLGKQDEKSGHGLPEESRHSGQQ